MTRLGRFCTAGALAVVICAPDAAAAVRVQAPADVGFADAFAYVVEAPAAAAAIVAPTAPFTRLGPPHLERTGSVARLTQQVACLDTRCLVNGPTRRVSLPRPRVRIGSRVVVGDAVTVVVRGRVTRTRVSAGDEAYLRDTSLPAPPAARPAAIGLGALALGLAAAALVLAAPRGSRRLPEVDAVLRAIRLLRESATRDSADRRRAAALLARVSRRRVDALAHEATVTAWARPAPGHEDALRLAARAEQELA